jgi:hypothetical protein
VGDRTTAAGRGRGAAMSAVSILLTLGILPSGKQGPALKFEELGNYLRTNCNTLEEKQRNARHCLRDELYRDGGVDHMKATLEKIFRDPKVRKLRQDTVELARFNNPLKRVVNEISTVYAEPAERHVGGDDEKYQRVLELVRMDEMMFQGSRLLNLHRAILMAPRVREKPDGSREPVLDIATPANVRAVLHPNDPCMVVGWLIRASAKPATQQDNMPAWTLWTDYERLQVREDMSPIVDSYLVHGLGVNPWCAVSLGPPMAGYWPGEEGEDLVAAHVSIWLSNILLLKEEKSATKQNVITGDVSMMARDQAADTESVVVAPDGTSIETIDMSMDLEMFQKVAEHILDTVGNNYGFAAALIHQQGVQSAEARELMLIPLRELRKHQQVPLRRFEGDVVVALAAVLRTDLPELAFDAGDFRVKFGESRAPLSRMERLELFLKERAAGTTDTIEYISEEHDMTPEEARAAMIKHNETETFRVELMRDMTALSGGAASEQPAAPTNPPAPTDPPTPTDPPRPVLRRRSNGGGSY